MDMQDRKVVTRLALKGSDLILIADLERRVNKAVGKFTFKDITPQNLNSIAWEANQVAKSVVGGHMFFNCEDNSLYSFSFMKIKVSKLTQEVSIIPCFKKEGGVFIEVSK